MADIRLTIGKRLLDLGDDYHAKIWYLLAYNLRQKELIQGQPYDEVTPSKPDAYVGVWLKGYRDAELDHATQP